MCVSQVNEHQRGSAGTVHAAAVLKHTVANRWHACSRCQETTLLTSDHHPSSIGYSSASNKMGLAKAPSMHTSHVNIAACAQAERSLQAHILNNLQDCPLAIVMWHYDAAHTLHRQEGEPNYLPTGCLANTHQCSLAAASSFSKNCMIGNPCLIQTLRPYSPTHRCCTCILRLRYNQPQNPTERDVQSVRTCPQQDSTHTRSLFITASTGPSTRNKRAATAQHPNSQAQYQTHKTSQPQARAQNSGVPLPQQPLRLQVSLGVLHASNRRCWRPDATRQCVR